MTDEARGPWELAIAYAATAGAYWTESAKHGGLKGLDVFARRWSAHAETAIAIGLDQMGEEERQALQVEPAAQVVGGGILDADGGEG